MKILGNYLVGEGIRRMDCLKNTEPMKEPELIVLHYTAGGSALSSAVYLARPDVGASAHLVVGRDGRIFQLVPFHICAWHAGQSQYQGRRDVNRFSIGIELDNAGKLHREHGEFFSDFGRKYMPDEVYVDFCGGKVSYWHRYTRCQIDKLKMVCDLLLQSYPIGAVVGHSDITTRKIDPGKALGSPVLTGRSLTFVPPGRNAYM